MIRRALAVGKRVMLPKVKGKELVLFEITNFDSDVSPGAGAFPSPQGNTGRPGGASTSSLCPARPLTSGQPAGYGAGFYDKLLSEFTGATVALAFELQIVPQVPG